MLGLEQQPATKTSDEIDSLPREVPQEFEVVAGPTAGVAGCCCMAESPGTSDRDAAPPDAKAAVRQDGLTPATCTASSEGAGPPPAPSLNLFNAPRLTGLKPQPTHCLPNGAHVTPEPLR